MDAPLWAWFAFAAVIVDMLTFDLLARRGAHVIGFKEALVSREIFLAAGVAVVSQFTAVLFVFAAILLYSAFKLMKDEDESYDPGKSVAIRLLRKVIPVRDEYDGTKFFVKELGKRVATPLLAVVVAVEAGGRHDVPHSPDQPLDDHPRVHGPEVGLHARP